MSGQELLICTLDMFQKVQKELHRTSGPAVAFSLEPWLIIKMQLIQVFSAVIILVDVHLNWLAWFQCPVLDGVLLFM